MPKLLELQLRMRDAVLGGGIAPELLAEVQGDSFPPEARLRIYRNHALTTLGAALESAFPVVCRLVDRRFFGYAAHEYLRRHPPHSRCVSEYGREFANFLAGFEPCGHLPYLADVARFEWALGAARRVPETPPLELDALAAVPAERAASLKISLQPSVNYLASNWPIDTIWLANQQKEVLAVDLAIGGSAVEIRGGERAGWQRLDPGDFAFRNALAEGHPLGKAATAAAAAEPAFDLAAALDRLFAERVAVGLDAC